MNEFDEKKVTKELLVWLRNWFEENGKGCNAVLGISGGKDSTVTAALCAKALGSDHVIGVLMPNGEQKDISDSHRVCNFLNIPNVTINIKDAVDAETRVVTEAAKKLGKEELTNQTIINLPPRIRMATLYALSQTMNGRVMNTCNLSEDWVGYSTRWGDSVGDVAPLAQFTVEEVRKIGLALGLPYDLVYKTPSDGLCGKTDEDSLGFTYAALDKYLRTGECDPATKALIDRKHQVNEFKLKPIPSYAYGKVLAKGGEKRRIGIYIGSFNPPHKGHIHAVNYLLNNQTVDKVLIVPTENYWDKQDLPPVEHRINMLKTYENDNVKIDTTNNGYPFTYELMRKLKEDYPDDELYLIMGADNIIDFNKWKNYEELLNYNIIVMNREGINIEEYIKNYPQGHFTVLKDFEPIDISSTMIRENPDSEYLDEPVLRYIKENNLYGHYRKR